MAESTREAVVRLLIEAKGVQGVTELQNRLDLTTGSISALNDAFARGDVTLEQYRRNIASLARQQKQLGEEVQIAAQMLAALQGPPPSNFQSLDDVKNKIELVRGSIAALDESFARGAIGVQEYATEFQQLSAVEQRLAADAAQAQAALDRLKGPEPVKFQSLDDVKAKLELVRGSIGALDESFARGAIGVQEYATEYQQLSTVEQRLAADAAQAQAALDRLKGPEPAKFVSLDQMNAKLELVRNSIAQFDQALARGEVSVDQYAREAADLGRYEQQLANDIAKATAAMANAQGVTPIAPHAIQTVAELKTRIELVQGSVNQLTEAFNRGDVSLEDYVRDMRQLDTVQKQLNQDLKIAETGVVNTSGKMSYLAQRTQAAGYAFQDFTATSGDLGQRLNSITNNIPNILAGFGGWAVAISVVVTAAVALYKNWDAISSLWEKRTPVKATDDLAGLEDQLKHVNKEIEASIKLGSLNDEQLKQYNSNIAERAVLEKKVSDEKERQNKLEEENKKLKGLESPTVVAEKKQRAEILQDSLGGQQGQVQSTIAQIMNTQQRVASEKTIKDLEARSAALKAQKVDTGDAEAWLRHYNEQLKTDRQLTEEKKKLADLQKTTDQKPAQDILRGALIEGNLKEFRQLEEMVKNFPHLFTEGQKAAVHIASPEFVQNDEAMEAGFVRRQEEVQNRDQRRAFAQKQQSERLNELIESAKVGGINDKAQASFRQLNKDASLSPEKIFQKVQAQVEDLLKVWLKSEGIDKPNAKAVSAAAISVTKKNLTDLANQEKGAERTEASESRKENAQQKKEDTAKQKAVQKKSNKQVKDFEDSAGDTLQKQFERDFADNQALAASGAKVATTAQQAAALKKRGQPFALSPELFQKNAKDFIADRARRQGAGVIPARKAADQIVGKGMTDYQKRLNGLSESGLDNQGKILGIAEQLNNEIERQMMQQVNLAQRTTRLENAVRTRSRTGRRTN